MRTGERQRDWKPLETHCPIDHSLETIKHSIHECKFVKHAFQITQDCFKVDISHVFRTDTLATLTTFAGVLAWSAVHVNWIIRCAIKKHQTMAPPRTAFLTKWCSYPAKWATDTHRFITL